MEKVSVTLKESTTYDEAMKALRGAKNLGYVNIPLRAFPWKTDTEIERFMIAAIQRGTEAQPVQMVFFHNEHPRSEDDDTKRIFEILYTKCLTRDRIGKMTMILLVTTDVLMDILPTFKAGKVKNLILYPLSYAPTEVEMTTMPELLAKKILDLHTFEIGLLGFATPILDRIFEELTKADWSDANLRKFILSQYIQRYDMRHGSNFRKFLVRAGKKLESVSITLGVTIKELIQETLTKFLLDNLIILSKDKPGMKLKDVDAAIPRGSKGELTEGWAFFKYYLDTAIRQEFTNEEGAVQAIIDYFQTYVNFMDAVEIAKMHEIGTRKGDAVDPKTRHVITTRMDYRKWKQRIMRRYKEKLVRETLELIANETEMKEFIIQYTHYPTPMKFGFEKKPGGGRREALRGEIPLQLLWRDETNISIHGGDVGSLLGYLINSRRFRAVNVELDRLCKAGWMTIDFHRIFRILLNLDSGLDGTLIRFSQAEASKDLDEKMLAKIATIFDKEYVEYKKTFSKVGRVATYGPDRVIVQVRGEYRFLNTILRCIRPDSLAVDVYKTANAEDGLEELVDHLAQSCLSLYAFTLREGDPSELISSFFMKSILAMSGKRSPLEELTLGDIVSGTMLSLDSMFISFLRATEMLHFVSIAMDDRLDVQPLDVTREEVESAIKYMREDLGYDMIPLNRRIREGLPEPKIPTPPPEEPLDVLERLRSRKGLRPKMPIQQDVRFVVRQISEAIGPYAKVRDAIQFLEEYRDGFKSAGKPTTFVEMAKVIRRSLFEQELNNLCSLLRDTSVKTLEVKSMAKVNRYLQFPVHGREEKLHVEWTEMGASTTVVESVTSSVVKEEEMPVLLTH